MEGNARLRRAWRARGLPDLPPPSLHRRQEASPAAPDRPLRRRQDLLARSPDSPGSAASSPDSPDSPASAASAAVTASQPVLQPSQGLGLGQGLGLNLGQGLGLNLGQGPPPSIAPAAPTVAITQPALFRPPPPAAGTTTTQAASLLAPVLAPVAPVLAVTTTAPSGTLPSSPASPASPSSVPGSPNSPDSPTKTTFSSLPGATQSIGAPDTFLPPAVQNPADSTLSATETSETEEPTGPPRPPPRTPRPEEPEATRSTVTETSATSIAPSVSVTTRAPAASNAITGVLTVVPATGTTLQTNIGGLPQATGSPATGPVQAQPTGATLGSDRDNGAGTKAGIAVGTIAGFGILVAIIIFLFKRHKRRRDSYLDKPYTTPAVVPPARQPGKIWSIQNKFQLWTTGRGNSKPPPPPPEPRLDERTQSQVLNDLFQAAYAAESGAMTGAYGQPRNDMATAGYPANEKDNASVSSRPLFLPAEQVEQPSLRSSIGRWLRGHHPLRMNPLGSKRSSMASSVAAPRSTTHSRFSPPSWAVPPPTVSSASSSIRGSVLVGDPNLVTPRTSLSPPMPRMPPGGIPPVPAIPPDVAMVSRWSDSTRQTPPSPSVRQSSVPSESGGGGGPRVSSLYDMYRRDTRVVTNVTTQSGSGSGSGSGGGGGWWPMSTAASDGSWNTNDLLGVGRASQLSYEAATQQQQHLSGAGGLDRASSNALPTASGVFTAGLPTPASTAATNSMRFPIQQPVPAMPPTTDLARRLESQENGDDEKTLPRTPPGSAR